MTEQQILLLPPPPIFSKIGKYYVGVAGFEPAPFHYYVLDLQSSAHPPSEQHSHKKQGTFNVLRRVGFEPTKLKIQKFQLLSIFNLAVCPLVYCDPAGARTQDSYIKC